MAGRVFRDVLNEVAEPLPQAGVGIAVPHVGALEWIGHDGMGWVLHHRHGWNGVYRSAAEMIPLMVADRPEEMALDAKSATRPP